MIVNDKEVCPTCGQTVNWRVIHLTIQMVDALWQVHNLCLKTGRHEFQRKELDPVPKKGTQYANFGYWKWFSNGAVYTPSDHAGSGSGRGWWGFNLDRMEKFFGGKTPVYTTIRTRMKGQERELVRDNLGYIKDIPDITVFLEGNAEYKEFVVNYQGGTN